MKPLKKVPDFDCEILDSETIASLISHLNEFEYLVLETMFEMFADLREAASYDRAKIPSIETVFDRSTKLVPPKYRGQRLDKQAVIDKFRFALHTHGIPESKPNKYIYRKKLREMASDLFFCIRENKDIRVLLDTTSCTK